MRKGSFFGIVFDLDDTLFDTTSQLIRPAVEEMCAAMVKTGLKATLEEAIKARELILAKDPRAEVIEELISQFGVTEGNATPDVQNAGFKAFYSREVPPIHCYSGVQEMLMELREKYSLFLVTLGSPPTQRRKVELLQLGSFFLKTFFVDISVCRGKTEALADILTSTAATPTRFLSVGNRLDKDLAPAKQLGMKTCWVRQGELRDMRPHSGEEVPDFEIPRIVDLAEACSL